MNHYTPFPLHPPLMNLDCKIWRWPGKASGQDLTLQGKASSEDGGTCPSPPEEKVTILQYF